jgi:hypothetical protein
MDFFASTIAVMAAMPVVPDMDSSWFFCRPPRRSPFGSDIGDTAKEGNLLQ